MTLNDAMSVWQSQTTSPLSLERIGELVSGWHRKSRRRVLFAIVFAVLVVVAGVFNFWGQYVVNGDGLLVAVLRALPVLMTVPVQVVVCRQLLRAHRERSRLISDHRKWLGHRMAEMEAEFRSNGKWAPICYFVFIIAVVAATKWIDFQSGEDSLGESIGILVTTIGIFVLVGAGMWHYRSQFLTPELERTRSLLLELNDAELPEE